MDWYLFLPIIVLVGTAFMMPGIAFLIKRRSVLPYLSLAGLLVSLMMTMDILFGVFSGPFGLEFWPSERVLSQFKMEFTSFSLFFHIVFLSVAILVVLASRNYIREMERNQGEYYFLLLISTVGMMLVASATDLFVLYLSLELSSLSTFALVGFRKKEKGSTEAAMKFFVIGVLSSAIVLFGIGLIYGVSGAVGAQDGTMATTDLIRLRSVFNSPSLQDFSLTAIVGIVFLIAGFGFKVATVPFHMWVPDVYEGAPTTITSFLAAGSKKMGVVAFFKIFLIAFIFVRGDWMILFGILAVATMTVGNVLALPQRNIKRMLAYSSIAQAGYILIALVVAGVAFTGQDGDGAKYMDIASYGLAGGMLHVLVHAFMKGGAFIVVAALTVMGVGDRIEDYKGLHWRSPILAFSLSIFLFSLAGIPPLGGFVSKFVLFSSAVYAGNWFVWLAVAGVLNSALSLYYYARVVRYMYTYGEKGGEKMKLPRAVLASVVIAVIMVVVIGLLGQPFIEFTQSAAREFFGIA